jgi:3-deoxy-D-manno-octulosonate 8-phosphate phosphatase (KDO 8-P phosphatase)
MPKTLRERCQAIDLIILDVDGVLTDGGITYATTADEVKTFHVRDGVGIKLWQRAGKQAGIITGRDSPAVNRRAQELDLTPVRQGVAKKLDALKEILSSLGKRPESVCCVGDDLPDLPLLNNCGLAVAVADACPEARDSAHVVTQAAGGRGAVREIVEFILRVQGRWHELVEPYRRVQF